MSDVGKPFACTALGCNQRFTNEDHLTVHKQKHEMTLKFGPPKFGDSALPVVADQTPTPTRFLRNCEEVGLFQELPNVNPFEHEFKKATEKQFAEKEAMEVGTTQPTNLVMKLPRRIESPNIETIATDSVGSSRQTMSSPETVSTTTNEDDMVVVVHSTVQEPVTVATPIAISSITTQAPSQLFAQVHHGSNPSAVPVVLRLPNGSTVPISIPAAIANPNVPFPTAISALPVTSQHMTIQQQHHQQQQQSEAKMKLKAALTQGNMNVMSQAVEVVTRQQQQLQEEEEERELAELEEQEMGEPQRARRRRNTDDDPDERRRKFLERNRAAATRCRNKKKTWIVQLEKKAEDLTQTNNQLQNEVSLLRNEVAQLKQLLLAHKDCPVTALQKTHLIAGHTVSAIQESSKSNSLHQITSVTAAEAVATSALTTMAHIATEIQTSQSSVSSN